MAPLSPFAKFTPHRRRQVNRCSTYVPGGPLAQMSCIPAGRRRMACGRRATGAADVTGTSIARARIHEEPSLRFPIVGVLRIGRRCRDARSSPAVGWSRRPHGRASGRDAPIALVAERGGHGDSREIVRTAERDPDSPPIDRPARRRYALSFEVGADSSRGAEVADASRIGALSPSTFCSDPDSRQRPAHLTRAGCGPVLPTSPPHARARGVLVVGRTASTRLGSCSARRQLARERAECPWEWPGPERLRVSPSDEGKGTRKTNGQSGRRPAGARTGGAAAGA